MIRSIKLLAMVLLFSGIISCKKDSVANISPTVSITAPANNATFNSSANILITAAATDADGSVTKVEFFNGATLLGTAITSPYTFIWTNAPAGTHSITAKATDNIGAITTSSAISIIVKANIPPTISITSPANNATFTIPVNIPIGVTAGDADGSISKIEYFNGATLLGTGFSFLWTNVPAGTHTLTAKVTDNLGAVTTSSAITITVNVGFSATLNGANETPPNASTATGASTASYNVTTKVLSITTTYSGVVATGAHIHKGAVGVAGGIIFGFGTTLASPIVFATAALDATQEADLLANLYYVNIHSAAFPGGEIRGQLIKQ